MFSNLNENKVRAVQKKIREDPVFFSEDKNWLNKLLWDKEKEILIALRDNSEIVVRSCNASGKTFTAARAVHWWLLGNEDSIVITTAPTFRQVKEILWREIKEAVARKPFYSLSWISETKINIDHRWFALGLSTDRPDQFQGIHSSHLLVIIDEASGVSDNIFEAIDGLKPNKILMIGNPLRNTGRFAKAFKERNNIKIHISVFDTPNLKASGYDNFEKFEKDWKEFGLSFFQDKNRIIVPGLITLADVVKFAQRYGIESDVFRVRVLGEFPKTEAESFITIDEVIKAMNREVEVLPDWEKKLGVDVARYGLDRTVFIVRQMDKIVSKEILVKRDTMEIAGRIIKLAKEEFIKPINIAIDQIGIGAGVVDALREQGWQVNGVNSTLPASKENQEHYYNIRAELGWRLKEGLKTLQLLKDDDFYEIANIKYKFNHKGQLLLESKEEMRSRGLPSPDVFDALCLTYAFIPKTLEFVAKEQGKGIQPFYPDIPGI